MKLILAWITDGLRESATSKSLAVSRDLTFKPTASAMTKPDGPPPMPEKLPSVALPELKPQLPIVAMNASPWAPLIAVAGQEHVRLIDIGTQKELGVLPFPEGVPHVIRFSRDGAVLLVAGGKPVQSGKAVLFDVRSGKRLAEIGDELDAVLAADLSPDQQLVAIGGSGKVVKLYGTSDGQLKYKLTRHTDWITAIGFSPDSSKLATADLSGGLHLWDPPKRSEGVYGRLQNGVLGVSFDGNGNLLSAGRDRVVRLWTPDGQMRRSFEVAGAIPVSSRLSHDGRTLICGDSLGEVHFWSAPCRSQARLGDIGMTLRLALLLILFAAPLLAEELDYRVLDPELKVVRLDSSGDDSFLSVRLDTAGRIFVGGRKTLFVYDLDEAGRYKPRHLLYSFPDHTWVNDIEIRGDDLYVVTVSAVYRLPGARLRREGVTIERLLWGVPNGHVHQCFHACAWGPGGALYVSMGDPLWYYGDFTRPDHWGHWTMFSKPLTGASRGRNKIVRVGNKDWVATPYNGVGAIFQLHFDQEGVEIRSFARGLRNPCGLCFDSQGNLFTNDNDHEGLPSAYVPGRLLHVTEGAYFSWPRGWLQSKSPDRADILPSLNENLGRFVPVLQTYYGDSYLPAKYDNNLLVARWCRRQITRFPLEAQGDFLETREFTAKEHVLLEGNDQARPVGVCVGRGGRVFATICYMAQNEGSPTYRSDLVVITRLDDPDTMPFDGYEATTVDVSRLREELRSADHSRTTVAYQELLRREQPFFRDKEDQEAYAKQREAIAKQHYKPLVSLERQMGIHVSRDVQEMRGRLQTYLDLLVTKGHTRALQQECLNLTQRDVLKMRERLCESREASSRLAGVLAVGFQLTIPTVDAKLPDDAPLTPQQKEEANIILFADEKEPIDLRKFGRVGNYTVAEHWKALKHTDEQEQLFALLVERLGDTDDKVRLQAAHFLSLLNDPRSEPKIATVTADVQDKRLNLLGKLEHVKPQVWMLGPVPDEDGFQTVHSVETAAIDLAAKFIVSKQTFEWKLTKATSPDRPLYNFNTLFGPSPNSSVYSLVRFDVPTTQRMQLLVGSEDGVKVWHNGKLVFTNDVVRPLQQLDDIVPLDLLAGSNDILVRVRMRTGRGGQYLHFKHLGDVKFSLPEKPDGLSLAERLKSVTETTHTGRVVPVIDPKFLEVNWSEAVKTGDVARGKKLFGAESLGCAKCHAATATQPGGGGPSLADSGKRFSTAYLVESVLAPNKVISPVFKSSTIETTDGKIITGLVVSETGDKLEVLLPDTKRISINKSDIEARKLVDISAMPPGIVKTPEELRDVIAYLLSNPTDSAK